MITKYKLLKMLEEANRTISHLHEEKRALEHALTLQSHSISPLPPSFPHPTHPSELSILRDRVAYLESALESALEAHPGDLGPDWNLGELDLDPQPHPYPYPHHQPYPQPQLPPHPHPSPLSSGYHSFTSSYSNPSELMDTQQLQQHYIPNGTQQQQHYKPNSSGSKNGQLGGKELDKRPPFISAVSPHSSRFAKPSAGAKLQIPKAPPDASKPVIRIDLSSEMSKTQPPKVKKKPSVYSSRTLPVSISPVTIANITHN